MTEIEQNYRRLFPTYDLLMSYMLSLNSRIRELNKEQLSMWNTTIEEAIKEAKSRDDSKYIAIEKLKAMTVQELANILYEEE